MKEDNPLVRIGLVEDVLDSLLHAVDGVRILVGDLDAELLLNRHHNLNGVQAIQTQVVCEVSLFCDWQGR